MTSFNAKQWQKLQKLLADGKTQAEAARVLSLSRQRVGQMAERLRAGKGIPQPPKTLEEYRPRIDRELRKARSFAQAKEIVERVTGRQYGDSWVRRALRAAGVGPRTLEYCRNGK